MKKVKFNIKFKEKIMKGNAKVFFNDSPVRIICWDRVGEFPILGLMKTDSWANPETVIEITNDGRVHIPPSDVSHNNGLHVHYTELPDRLYRVKYSVMRMTDQRCLWKKYGYMEDESKSYYENSCHFVNDIVPKYLFELHEELKNRGNWTYDDDEDWNFDFKYNDKVVCVNNKGTWGFVLGDIYNVGLIDQVQRVIYIDQGNGCSKVMNWFEFIDRFNHASNTDDGERYDFTKMKAFTPVLARDGEHNTWFPHFFESFHPQNLSPFRMIDTRHVDYLQCVPYEGNEELLNTQKPIPDYYRVKR